MSREEDSQYIAELAHVSEEDLGALGMTDAELAGYRAEVEVNRSASKRAENLTMVFGGAGMAGFMLGMVQPLAGAVFSAPQYPLPLRIAFMTAAVAGIVAAGVKTVRSLNAGNRADLLGVDIAAKVAKHKEQQAPASKAPSSP